MKAPESTGQRTREERTTQTCRRSLLCVQRILFSICLGEVPWGWGKKQPTGFEATAPRLVLIPTGLRGNLTISRTFSGLLGSFLSPLRPQNILKIPLSFICVSIREKYMFPLPNSKVFFFGKRNFFWVLSVDITRRQDSVGPSLKSWNFHLHFTPGDFWVTISIHGIHWEMQIFVTTQKVVRLHGHLNR